MPTTTYPKHVGDIFKTGKHVDLVVVECTCGILFAIPEKLNRSALTHRGQSGWQISCPLGHTWHYTGDNEETRLRKQLEREREHSASLVSRLDQTEAHLRGEKAAKTRIKNERDRLKQRATAGVCPHPECHRHFENLERHVATKHPELLEQLHAGSAD